MTWSIGTDGKWDWDWRCEACGGRGSTSRAADRGNPIERGYEHWHTPCRACDGTGRAPPPEAGGERTTFERMLMMSPEECESTLLKMFGSEPRKPRP